VGFRPSWAISLLSRQALQRAIRSFFHYAALEAPEQAALIECVLAIPRKRQTRPLLDFLIRPEIEALLSAPDLPIGVSSLDGMGRRTGGRRRPGVFRRVAGFLLRGRCSGAVPAGKAGGFSAAAGVVVPTVSSPAFPSSAASDTLRCAPRRRDVDGQSMGVLESADVVLEVANLGKSFPGVQALAGVFFRLRRGEVHAVVGENGAGKSTFMRLLAGLETPDDGEIRFRGRPVRLRHPHAARQLGVAMIHQELMPFLDLTVAENILMGRERTRGPFGWVDRAAQRREAQRLLRQLDVPVSPDCRMRELGVAEMQAVEIARAIGCRAEVMIMDEPTSALSERETRALFRVMGDLRRQGGAIIYISHRLEEVFELADTVTVLRDGRHVVTGPVTAFSRQSLIESMVGPPKPQIAEPRPRIAGVFGGHGRAAGEPDRAANARPAEDAAALVVRGLSRAGAFADVSFAVHRGEIVGLTGLVGAGRTELAQALFGLVEAEAGEVRVHGVAVRLRSPRQAIDHGIALLTEDRKRDGLVLTMSVMHNLTLSGLDRCSRGGWINGRREEAVADALIADFGVRIAHREQSTGTLSGGNQQKVALGKALLPDPDIVILDEPTRGIDVGAKAEIYGLIRRLAQSGKAILLNSSELPEVLALSDRILVMRQGRLSAALDPRRATPAEILHWAMPE